MRWRRSGKGDKGPVRRNPEALEAQRRAAQARAEAEAGLPEARQIGDELRQMRHTNHFAELVADALGSRRGER